MVRSAIICLSRVFTERHALRRRPLDCQLSPAGPQHRKTCVRIRGRRYTPRRTRIATKQSVRIVRTIEAGDRQYISVNGASSFDAAPSSSLQKLARQRTDRPGHQRTQTTFQLPNQKDVGSTAIDGGSARGDEHMTDGHCGPTQKKFW